jgi:hypothetical protein
VTLDLSAQPVLTGGGGIGIPLILFTLPSRLPCSGIARDRETSTFRMIAWTVVLVYLSIPGSDPFAKINGVKPWGLKWTLTVHACTRFAVLCSCPGSGMSSRL